MEFRSNGNFFVISPVTYYVCPAGQTVANYDGDGLNTAVTPSDSNDGLTKATPLATIAAAAAKFAGKVLLAPVTIQLADTDADKAYFPDGVVFDNICSGGSVAVFDRALMSETDVYPTSYVYVKGNTATPNNVAVVGATTYNGTTPSKLHAFICRFSNLRVRGMQFKYFAADCIAGDNRALLIVESCNGIQLSTYTGLDQDGLVHVSQQSHVKFGGTCTISEMPFVNADNSTVEFGTPLGYVTLNFSASGTNAQFAILADEKSHIYVEGITATFSGSGTYNAFGSLVGSSINWNGDIATNITVNGANITFLKARQGGHISDFSGGFLQTTNFTSMLRRAWAAEHSTITYAGTTQGTSPDLCTGGSTILNGSFPYTAKQTSPMTTYLEFNEVSAPSTPSANAIRLYAKDNAGTSALFVKDDAGTETQLGAGIGSLTEGSIPFAGASGAIEEDNGNLFWNSATKQLVVQGQGPTFGVGFILRNEGQQNIFQMRASSGTASFHGNTLGVFRSRGTIASPAIVQNNDTVFMFNGDVWDGAAQQTCARMEFAVDGTPGTNDTPGRIAFSTTADGANSPTTRMIIKASGSVIIGNSSSALSTAATDGFLYVPTCAGTPTGTPTTVTGVAPIVIDTTNHKLYFRSGGSWRDAGP